MVILPAHLLAMPAYGNPGSCSCWVGVAPARTLADPLVVLLLLAILGLIAASVCQSAAAQLGPLETGGYAEYRFDNDVYRFGGYFGTNGSMGVVRALLRVSCSVTEVSPRRSAVTR